MRQTGGGVTRHHATKAYSFAHIATTCAALLTFMLLLATANKYQFTPSTHYEERSTATLGGLNSKTQSAGVRSSPRVCLQRECSKLLLFLEPLQTKDIQPAQDGPSGL